MALIEIKVPDVGTAEVDVVDVLIKAGDIIAAEQTLAVLETDKASMDLPSSAAGTVQEVFIKKGDKVAEGTLIATLLVSAEAPAAPEIAQPAAPVSAPAAAPEPVAVATAPAPKLPKPAPVVQAQSQASNNGKAAHATPAVRLFARELGVDISGIKTGTGRKGRILKDDVKNFVKKSDDRRL